MEKDTQMTPRALTNHEAAAIVGGDAHRSGGETPSNDPPPVDGHLQNQGQ